jgi:hypothetical protein
MRPCDDVRHPIDPWSVECRSRRIQGWYHAFTDRSTVRNISSQCAKGAGVGRTKAVKSRREPCRLKSRLFVAVGAAVERGPISKWKTDRLGMGHKLPQLKSDVSRYQTRVTDTTFQTWRALESEQKHNALEMGSPNRVILGTGDTPASHQIGDFSLPRTKRRDGPG